ncbi:hypothetical protein VSDG_00956 [Cytospora chrysosperma]|uniref:Uncharacterized protein n=1 Tax=Cytospora chrysosperma TaxID=252740 RepID=A0A423WL62_CYTCH|nr:hypothetical protein VSDG_00956 [Valsa sordida]
MSGGAMAGAIVGSVCGLGIIAAVCLYLFWFRPRQKEKDKKGKEDSENKAAAEAEAKRREEVSKAELAKPHELQQQPPELHSPDGIMELPIEGIFEAPGDRGGVEVDNAAQLPVELPGDHMYWSSISSGSSDGAQRYQR